MSKEKFISENQHVIDGITIVNKIIEIGLTKFHDFITGNAHLINCEIRIKCSGNAVNFSNSIFENCLIKTTRELNNVHFGDNSFISCTFKGKYSGCRFGETKIVRDCDFSDAKMDLCDFFEKTEIETLKFPLFPFIVISDIKNNSKDWAEIKFNDDEFELTQETVLDIPIAKAIIINLNSNSDDPEKIYEILKHKNYIKA